MSNTGKTQAKAPDAPFSQEAEEAVLGSILIDPESFLGIAGFLKKTDFFLLRHQYIWETMETIIERGEPIDPVVLAEELENKRLLETVGGRAYLIQITNSAGTSMYAEVYGRLVERTARRRDLMKIADEIKSLARDESTDIESVFVSSETKLFTVTQSASQARSTVPLWEALSDYYDDMERMMQHPEKGVGVPSGFRDVDYLTGGYQRSDLIIFAGRPGSGKTSFLMGVAMNVARFGGRVGVFSMEMSKDQLIMRLISMETGISVQKLRLGKLSSLEAARFTEAIGRMSKWQMYLDDTPALSPAELRTKSRRLMAQYGLDLLIVDYVQLMRAEMYQHNRVQEVSYISRTTKELAKELNIPIIAAAQLNRELEHRKDKRPILSDLKESGSLEQDADVVQFIYRDDMYNENTEFPNQAEIITAKHRNGPTGVTALYFEKQLTKFMDASVHRVDLSGLE